MSSRIYESDVHAGLGNSGEYTQVRIRCGRVEARKIELFTYGPTKTPRWSAATVADVVRANAPKEWERLAEDAERHATA